MGQDETASITAEVAQFAPADIVAPTSTQMLAAMLRDPSRLVTDGSGQLRYFLHQPIVDQFLADNP